MQETKKAVDRRVVLAGAGAVGALAAAASMLRGGKPADAVATVSQDAPVPDTSGGYRLTEHVKRYYATTKI